MSVAFRASALSNDGSTSQTSSINVTVPATAQATDTALFCMLQISGTNTFTAPAGWTLLRGPDVLTSNHTVYLWAKKLVSGDPGSVLTFTSNGSARTVGAMEVLSGGDTLSEIIVTLQNNSPPATTINAPNVTTTESDCQIVNFWAARAAVASAVDITPSAPQTSDGVSNTAFASIPNAAVLVSHRSTNTGAAGVQTGATATATQSSTAVVYSVAVTSATTDITAPSVPTGVDAVATASTSVTISWTASTDAGSGVASYRIRRGGVDLTGATALTGTSFVDSTVTAGQTYSYTVSAIDAAGNRSAESTADSVTTPLTGLLPGLKTYVIRSGIKVLVAQKVPLGEPGGTTGFGNSEFGISPFGLGGGTGGSPGFGNTMFGDESFGG